MRKAGRHKDTSVSLSPLTFEEGMLLEVVDVGGCRRAPGTIVLGFR